MYFEYAYCVFIRFQYGNHRITLTILCISLYEEYAASTQCFILFFSTSMNGAIIEEVERQPLNLAALDSKLTQHFQTLPESFILFSLSLLRLLATGPKESIKTMSTFDSFPKSILCLGICLKFKDRLVFSDKTMINVSKNYFYCCNNAQETVQRICQIKLEL